MLFANSLQMPARRGRRGVKLQDATLSSAYRRHLKEAGVWLLGLVAEMGGTLGPRSSARVVDKWLEKAVNEGYRNGEKLYWITLGVLSLQRRYGLSGAYLKTTWSALRAWRLLQPIKPRIPITHYILQCLLVVMLARGFAHRGLRRLEWWSSMLGCWLAFTGLMRPGEVDGLQVRDLCFPEAPEMAEGIGLLVSIRQAKTRRVWAHQFVIIETPQVVEWLRWWTAGSRPKDRVLRVGRRRWSTLLKEALASLNVGECGFSLASFRGGGACHHFKTNKNLGMLQFAGRWQRPETLRHYVQEALGVHALAQAPSTARDCLREVYAHVGRLEHPPPFPLAQLLE